jgi:hypothetical protein
MLLYTVDRLSVQSELWSPIVQGHEHWRESQLSATADLASDHKLGFYGNKQIEREYGESAT